MSGGYIYIHTYIHAAGSHFKNFKHAFQAFTVLQDCISFSFPLFSTHRNLLTIHGNLHEISSNHSHLSLYYLPLLSPPFIHSPTRIISSHRITRLNTLSHNIRCISILQPLISLQLLLFALYMINSKCRDTQTTS